MTPATTIELTPLEDPEQHWLALHACRSWPELHQAVERLLVGTFQVLAWSLYIRTDDGLTRIEAVDSRPVDGRRAETAEAGPDDQLAQALKAEHATVIARDSRIDTVVPFGEAVGGGLVLTTASALSSVALGRLVAHLHTAIARVRTIEFLRSETNLDATTELLNARSLRESLRRELMRGQRYGHPVAVLFLDLDRFKSVNDQHGHIEGTALLRYFAQRLKEAIRKVDLAFRYGGDEFVLLLVQTSREAAERAAHRLQEELASAPFYTSKAQPLTITVSIGVAAFPEDGEKVEMLLRAADKALYRAKAQGRNEVVSTQSLERFDPASDEP
ncbi:MAG: GGDEF domain-containing protein [Myxococcota bacterium]